MQTHTQLSLKIKALYPGAISDTDAIDAAARLVSFFKILVAIDKEQRKPKEEAQGG